MLLKQGGDYGWPECYYDGLRKKLVLAPEYGGDGGDASVFAPTSSLRLRHFPRIGGRTRWCSTTRTQFPARYRDGVFIAFHGSWNRAPYAQGGYNVVFQPLAGDHASGRCEIFADGFAGEVKTPDGRRASSEWPGRGTGWVALRFRRYSRTDLPDHISAAPARRRRGEVHTMPEFVGASRQTGGSSCQTAGRHESGCRCGNSGSGSAFPQAPRREMVALGNSIYHGQVAGAACTGCHGVKAQGSPLGPDLDRQKMVMERWQLCRNRENDNRRRAATQEISQPHAADGRIATHARASTGVGCVHLEPEPLIVAHAELIAEGMATYATLAVETFQAPNYNPAWSAVVMERAYRNLGYVLVALLPIFVAGFWIPYLSQIPRFDESITTAVHIHAALLFCFLVLLIVQPLAIRYKAFSTHRILGSYRTS